MSFAGNLTFPKARKLREAARQIPLERLLVETDAPFLAPQAKRGKRNEPAFVVHTAGMLAELKSISFEAMQQHLFDNAQICFATAW